MSIAREQYLGDDVEYATTAYDACRDADALILLTEWLQYRRPEWSVVRGLLKEPVVFDGRNQFEPARMREIGFRYYPIGREQVE